MSIEKLNLFKFITNNFILYQLFNILSFSFTITAFEWKKLKQEGIVINFAFKLRTQISMRSHIPYSSVIWRPTWVAQLPPTTLPSYLPDAVSYYSGPRSPVGIRSETPSRCLKAQTVPNPVHAMLFAISVHSFSWRKHFAAPFLAYPSFQHHYNLVWGLLLNKIRFTWTQAMR